MMERIIAPENLRAAYRRVKSNKGAPGIDGMRVEELAGHLRQHWPMIREQLHSGTYRPAPVRRHEIEKTGGGIRILGIPTGLDRLIQQAILRASPARLAFDVSRKAALAFDRNARPIRPWKRAQSYYRAGCHWVVDLDLEQVLRPGKSRQVDGAGLRAGEGLAGQATDPPLPESRDDERRTLHATRGRNAARRAALTAFGQPAAGPTG